MTIQMTTTYVQYTRLKFNETCYITSYKHEQRLVKRKNDFFQYTYLHTKTANVTFFELTNRDE